MNVNEKAALVTGAGSGIGRATAHRLPARGCAVAINDLDPDAAGRVVDEIEGAGGRAIAAPGDVSADADCRASVARATDGFGRLDVLVNNAGTTALIPHDDLDAIDDALWERTPNVNLKGPFQMVRAARAALDADGGGEVVNVSSFASVYGTGSCIPYCTSKAGLNMLTLTLARVLGPNVRIDAVAPGFIDGPWRQRAFGDAFDDVKQMMEKKSLLGKVCTPDDAAAAIMSFVEGSDLVTGQILVVDGGSGIAG